MSEPAEQIAARLTEAQRETLRRFDDNPESSIFDVWAPLAHARLITRKAGTTDAALTPLGVAVRAVLARQ